MDHPSPAHARMAELLAFARALPGAKEDDYRGQAAVCIRSTPFMLAQRDGSALFRLPRLTQERLVREDPATYCASAGRWGQLGWTRVSVACVEPGALRALVVEAHARVAERYAQRTLSGRPR